MPFENERVEIVYQAIVQGLQDVERLKAENQALQNQLGGLAGKTHEAATTQQKHNNALIEGHRAVRLLHRELSVFRFALGTTAVVMAILAKGSTDLASSLQTLGKESLEATKPVGDLFAKLIPWLGGKGFQDPNLSITNQAGLSNMFSQIDTLRGDTHAALVEKLRGEEIQLAEKVGDKWNTVFKKVFDMRSKLMLEDHDRRLKLETDVQTLGLQADVNKLRGDDHAAMINRLDAEEMQLSEKIRTYKKGDQDIIKQLFNERREMMIEESDLAEVGLKRQSQIMKDFRKDVIEGFRKDTGDTLFNFLEGKKQGFGDILKSFRSTANRAVSEAFTQSLFTSMSGKGGKGGFMENFMNTLTGKKEDTQLKEISQSNARIADTSKTLLGLTERIANCVCASAEALGAIKSTIPTSATLTGGGPNIWQKLATVTGAISTIAGGVGSLGSAAGVANPGLQPSAGMAPREGMMTAPQSNANLFIDTTPRGHSGMEIPMFPSGGEVPIMAQPGEFIVRKSVAQDNKEVLKSMNSGARQSKNAQNIYFINANDAKSFSDMLSSPSAQQTMEMQITRAIMNNGSLRDAIRSFGRG